jgi:hypothetical protein
VFDKKKVSRIHTVGNNLSEDGLRLVSQGFIGSVVTVRSELKNRLGNSPVGYDRLTYFEWFSKLPFKINGQADRDLISGKSVAKTW